MSIRNACFEPYGAGFSQPTPEEVRILIKRLGLTGSETAQAVGADPRTVRRWMSDSEKTPIPYSAWRLLVTSES